MKYGYVYQRSGGPLLSWRNGPPLQSRAADTVALGTLAEPTLVLPRPGAPEPINDATVAMGCACQDKAKAAFAGVSDSIASLSAPVKIGGALALAYLLHKHLKKRR